MFRLAPNIGPLFTEAGDSHADRVRAAASAGLYAVEVACIRELVSDYAR